MPTPPVISDDLIAPIEDKNPAGANLRFTQAWLDIEDACREDDALEQGAWKKERKTANWLLVKQLASLALSKDSKDLHLAIRLTEANIKLHGYAGLRDSLRLIRELLVRFWDLGLYPPIEDGDLGFRSGPLEWLNERMAVAIRTIPMTSRSDQGENYSYFRFLESLRVGSERDLVQPNGDPDEKKKQTRETHLKNGLISAEMYAAAVQATPRAQYEILYEDLEQAYLEFKELDRVAYEKFGDNAPGFSASKAAFEDCRTQMETMLKMKRKEEPDLKPSSLPGSSPASDAKQERVMRQALPSPSLKGDNTLGTSWEKAEELVRSGQIDQGLAEMTRLAAMETSGRARFHRKLLLAEICLTILREPLARTILEELAEQIDGRQLDSWESSEIVARVWSRLYGLYKKGGGGTQEVEKASKLLVRLCRLDPWQAFACGD